jgi:hypothetical protein
MNDMVGKDIILIKIFNVIVLIGVVDVEGNHNTMYPMPIILFTFYRRFCYWN